MSTAVVDLDDLKLVLNELSRTSQPSTAAVHAANRLREAIAPGLIPAQLPDPKRNTPGRAHGAGGDVERANAERVAPRTGTLRFKALLAIAEADPGGLTNFEIASLVGAPLYSCAPRVTELAHDGWIRDSGDRRQTPLNGEAIVWRISDRGRELINEYQRAAS